MDTTSFWIDSAPLPTFPALSTSLDVDVVVVGAGIMGITAAYLAKKAGKRVALIERGRAAMVDTGHTTAHLTAVTDLRLFEIAETFGKDAARATWDAGLAAIDQIVSLIRAEDIECDFHWVPGYLHTSMREPDPKKIDELEKESKIAAELGIRQELLAEVPVLGLPGIKFPHQALFHPRKYLKALLETIPGDGSFVFENTSSDEIIEQPLAVKSGRHTIRTSYIIVATHNPLQGSVSTVSAMLFQTKLALYSTYALGAKIPLGSAPEAAFWDTSDPYDYIRIDRREDHEYVIYGGEDHKTGQVEDTRKPYDQLERRLLKLWPGARVDHRWSGQVIETNDGLPLMGEMAEKQFAATGFAGNGMTFGTLGAMMAVDALIGRPNPWKDLFDLHRKKLLGGTWTYLTENVDYPFYLLRNWIAKGEGDTLDVLGRGEGKILKLNGKKVAAYRNDAGKVSLCSPVCTHMKCIVDWNPAEKTWDCPCHGSRFQPTGEVISGPAEEPLEKMNVEGLKG